jgi:hypothetical protein
MLRSLGIVPGCLGEKAVRLGLDVLIDVVTRA